ncbi:RidA family protein [Sphingobium algorifonticola]|uniref:RidA family protein n=1 Tax=Sphingobium algorifonticola TaxID=2008318 RepID=A0A437JBZ4_9SPHN|nr:RidA family protein [Sphingobium algorifonticola]RVT43290.1 RidA family protein [Sphingobium algorifonticola]
MARQRYRARWVAIGIATLVQVAAHGAAPLHAQTAASPGPQYLGPVTPGRPLSSAVRAGDTLYLSGQLGTAADGTLPPDFDTQARNAMANVAKTAALGGASLDDLVKCTVMLADMQTWPRFNEIYITYFKPGRLPARSAFGSSGLARGAAVEVECIAYMGR